MTLLWRAISPATAARSPKSPPIGASDQSGCGSATTSTPARVEDAYELARVALLRVAGGLGTANRRDEVVRADEHRRERGTEGRDERELLADEVVGRVAVHRGVPQLDLAT